MQISLLIVDTNNQETGAKSDDVWILLVLNLVIYFCTRRLQAIFFEELTQLLYIYCQYCNDFVSDEKFIHLKLVYLCHKET